LGIGGKLLILKSVEDSGNIMNIKQSLLEFLQMVQHNGLRLLHSFLSEFPNNIGKIEFHLVPNNRFRSDSPNALGFDPTQMLLLSLLENRRDREIGRNPYKLSRFKIEISPSLHPESLPINVASGISILWEWNGFECDRCL
jgi:hypothetical protein